MVAFHTAKEKMPEIRLGIGKTTDPKESDGLMTDYIKVERIEV